MNFRNMIFGGLEDQVESFVQGPLYSFVGAPFGRGRSPIWQSNQPIFSIFYDGGSAIFDPVAFSNIFAVLSVLLTLIFSFVLFRFLKLEKLLSIVLSIVFALSPYTFLHMGIHPALSQIWLVPLCLTFFLKMQMGIVPNKLRSSLCDFILCGTTLAAAVLISNYLGFFLILFALCFCALRFLFSSFLEGFSLQKLILEIKKIFLIFFAFLVIVIPFLLPYIKANYIGETTNLASEGFSSVRTLEDFQNFSARPWYFILPPLAHPILGPTITGPVLDWMKNDWGYFLADDYFPKEHGGDYLGWFNLTLFLVAVTFAMKDIGLKLKTQTSKIKTTSQNLKSFYSGDNLKLVVTLVMAIVLSFLFTMPPFFTISGHKIYTLGFVLYKFFPMFRVTARMGVVILMCVLIVNGLFLQKLLVQNQKLKSKVKSFLILYASFTLFEFYVPISTFDTSKVPQVYEYLSEIDEKVAFDFIGPSDKKGRYEGPLIIAEYPSGRSEDIFWITEHRKGLINPRMYQSLDFGYYADVFTKSLSTEGGLENARELGVSYLVFHKGREPKEGEEEFFREHLNVEGIFGDIILFKF